MFVASVIAISAFASVAQAATVSELMVQYPDGGKDFGLAVHELFRADPVGTASAIAQAWPTANEAQKSGMVMGVGDGGCTGNQSTTAIVKGLLPFKPTGACVEGFQTRQSSFKRTATGTDQGTGFGGGSISPNTQQTPNVVQ